MPKPIKLFEITDVVLKDDASDVGAINRSIYIYIYINKYIYIYTYIYIYINIYEGISIYEIVCVHKL